MNRISKIGLIIACVLFVFIVLLQFFFRASILQVVECYKSGGGWQRFTDGCADFCWFIRRIDPGVCSQSVTLSCDCGPEKCWNGNSCKPN
ncbi:hypothetical protein FJY90_01020 [Candidatus Gottesmanbacteria bacterium]|nr:hypothetical protein [Candidatus Gottesmanbacteria bacterium]